MSTRAAIGFQRDDKSFVTIYSHYDGYPDHVGKLLVEHWNSFEKCEELVNGPQIRNFDNDGTCVRFGDSSAGAKEEFDSIDEILSDVYDYCYLWSEQNNRWECYTHDRTSRVVEKEIPGEEPAAEEPAPFKSLNEVIGDFVKASDAKYNGYSHAAGYLSGMLLQAEARLPAEFVQLMIEHMTKQTEECRA